MTVTINGTTGVTTPATILSGSSSGSTTLQATAVASGTSTIPASTGTVIETVTNMAANPVTGTPSSSNYLRGDGTWAVPVSGFTSGTVQTPSSGTTVLFTGIPSTAKQITVMLSNLGTGATSSAMILQLGSTTIQATGYVGLTSQLNNAAAVTPTTYFALSVAAAASLGLSGQIILSSLGNNIWTASFLFNSSAGSGYVGAGAVTMTGVVDRLQIGTVAGTAVFSTGSINIIYQ